MKKIIPIIFSIITILVILEVGFTIYNYQLTSVEYNKHHIDYTCACLDLIPLIVLSGIVITCVILLSMYNPKDET